MKVTKELIEKYAGKTYDDGEYRGIIAGFDSNDNIRPILLNEATRYGEDCATTSTTGWGSDITVFKPWEGQSPIKWCINFNPSHIEEEESQYTYMDLDEDYKYPTWWDATKPPILCWVSDENGEERDVQKYVLAIKPLGDFRYTTLAVNGFLSNSKYATPVVTPSKEELEKTSKLEALRETMRVAQEQIDEILGETKQ